ncbi:MAG: endonuclease VIII [Candidatus Coatesbacteria bacterium]|nr:endonuclease VIII [Candidatus Coatesbacteria bacterium]
MFELPEIMVLAGQMNGTLKGKVISKGSLGNSAHKWVWYNRSHEEFEKLTGGKSIGEAYPRGRWLCIPLEPGFVLVLGEFGGKALYHASGSKPPKKYHLLINFEDGSFFTLMTQMWGAIELYAQGEELQRNYIKDMRTTPTDAAFTLDYFNALIDELVEGQKRSAKSLLTQDQIIPGLGNAIAQDILFRARIHPRRAISELTKDERESLYRAITDTVSEIRERGGRYDEYDLFGNLGGYIRLMDKNASGKPCPECGTTIEKIQYLGGSCYLCPTCQVL